MYSGALAATPILSLAQSLPKTRRLGMLLSDSASKEGLGGTFFQRLKELGWSEGSNLAVEYRFARGTDQFPQLATELVQQKVDVIFTGGSPFPLDAARKATTTIPIVFSGGYSDNVSAGVIQSLARPGGNITGVSFVSGELLAKRFELLKEVIPSLSKIGVLRENGAASYASQQTVLIEAARTLKIEMATFSLRDPGEFESVAQSAKNEKVGGLFVNGTPLFASRANVARLAELLIKYQLPAIGAWNYMADAGFLMGYSADPLGLLVKAAGYIDKIFRGANPGELPVEEPTRYELVVNLKAAKALKIVVPKAIILRADRVIE